MLMNRHTLQLAMVIFSDENTEEYGETRRNTEKYGRNTEPGNTLNYGRIRHDIRMMSCTVVYDHGCLTWEAVQLFSDSSSFSTLDLPLYCCKTLKTDAITSAYDSWNNASPSNERGNSAFYDVFCYFILQWAIRHGKARLQQTLKPFPVSINKKPHTPLFQLF